ncbi:hypothetical protein [Bacillus weihaiensis]|uniref:hypothetical protein n=1 Tax=Bacillus weihaiensis TaxID=1547283 RepID=UPI002352A5F2|nr:hypothetical protein [Bacillus weihaiensis]
MNILEQLFEGWMERNERSHEQIQQRSDQWMRAKEKDFIQLDRTADSFDHKMETVEKEIEKWRERHKGVKE